MQMMKQSAKEIKNLKIMVLCALLIAVALVVEILNPLNSSSYLKVSFSFIPLALIGYFGGPVTGIYVGLLYDIINFMFSKDGTSFVPLYTLLEMLGLFIYGLLLYRKNRMWVKKPLLDVILKCTLAKTFINIFVNSLGNSFLNIYLYGVAKHGIWLYIFPRIIKNITLLPAEIAVLVIIIYYVKNQKTFSVWLNK